MASINPKMRPQLRHVLDCGIFDTEITRFNTNLAINGYFDVILQNQKIMNAKLGSVDTDMQIKNGINDEILVHRFEMLKESVGDTHILKNCRILYQRKTHRQNTTAQNTLIQRTIFRIRYTDILLLNNSVLVADIRENFCFRMTLYYTIIQGWFILVFFVGTITTSNANEKSY
ncbi:Hypothetical_protein [Hexamita inflata]|uniref:Hypothetical_protein n=1 Tax=Hexamita inflata TaxID=28002 RepID=A0AA86R111_9EUKA|nr:Hypothetical protein HINF_LOCUS52556 [Hexamita inflata]